MKENLQEIYYINAFEYITYLNFFLTHKKKTSAEDSVICSSHLTKHRYWI